MSSVFKVEIVRDVEAQKQTLTNEFYVADRMLDVIEKLSVELRDSRAEVRAIVDVAPVLQVIQSKTKTPETGAYEGQV